MFSKILVLCAFVALSQSGHLNGGHNPALSNGYLPPIGQGLSLSHGVPGHAFASNLLNQPGLGHNVPLHAPSPYSGQLASPYSGQLASPYSGQLASPYSGQLASPFSGPLANNGAVSHTYIRQVTPLVHPANVNYATSVLHGNSVAGVSPQSLGASLPQSGPLAHPNPLISANPLAPVGPLGQNVPWAPNAPLGLPGSPGAALAQAGPLGFPNYLNRPAVLPHLNPLLGSTSPVPHAIPRAPINPLYQAGAFPSNPLAAGLNNVNGLPYGNISPAGYPLGGNIGPFASGYASSYPKYEFSYSVRDPLTGDHKNQQEIREGDAVKGEYSLVQPDGALRKVSYSDNGQSGFKAVVENSSPNHHTYSEHL